MPHYQISDRQGSSAGHVCGVALPLYAMHMVADSTAMHKVSLDALAMAGLYFQVHTGQGRGGATDYARGWCTRCSITLRSFATQIRARWGPELRPAELVCMAIGSASREDALVWTPAMGATLPGDDVDCWLTRINIK